MDKNSRLVLLLLFVALAVYRLVRYVQLGTGRRRISAIPGTSMPVISSAEAPRSAANLYLIRLCRDIRQRVSAKSEALVPPANPLT